MNKIITIIGILSILIILGSTAINKGKKAIKKYQTKIENTLNMGKFK